MTDTQATWAQTTVNRLYTELRDQGGWRAVAAALRPHLDLSHTAWSAVGRGEKVTPAKIDALRAYCGKPPLHRQRPRTISVRLLPADAAILDTLRQPGESRPACIRRLCRARSE